MTHSPLRVITCGSVGAGKTTLIDRLLSASQDQAAGGLFSVADAPGNGLHKLVMDAPTADLALLVVDAREGLLSRTQRHSQLLRALGIRYFVLAVNKMDMVGCDEAVFRRIEAAYRDFASRSAADGTDRTDSTVALPLAGLGGDNVAAPSARTPWYRGPTLLQHLDTLASCEATRRQARPLRLPVQDASQTHGDAGACAGTLASGSVHVGQRVCVQPGGRCSTVARIATPDGDLRQAVAYQSVVLTLADAFDISRGDVISAADNPAEVADQFNATVAWLHDAPMLPGRGYLLQIGGNTVNATLLSLRHKLHIDTLEPLPAERLEQGEIAVVEVDVDRPLAFDAHRDNKVTGSFVLIDRIDRATVGTGMLNFALRRAHNIRWQALEVDKAARQRLAGHRSAVVWLTGLSGAGKSTIANLLEKRLHARGVRSYLLDGDNLRHGLNKDLGFTAEARAENIRRVAEVARLMVDAGVVVIAAFISPFRAERRMARDLMEAGEFVEVFVDTPLAVAEQRDVKGLYKKARRGELKNFTGIDSPYEPPEAAEIVIDTGAVSAVDAAELLFKKLVALRLFG